MSGLNSNSEEMQQQQQQQVRLLHALSQSDPAAMEGFMSGAFSSFTQPMNLTGMMQGMARQGITGAPVLNGRGAGRGTGGLGIPAMNLAPFSSSGNFNAGNNTANGNFLAFISPNNGGRGGPMHNSRPGTIGNGTQVAIPAVPSSSTTPTSSIPPTGSNLSRDSDTKNVKRKKSAVMSADGSLLLLPRNDQSPSPTNGVSSGHFSSLTSGQNSSTSNNPTNGQTRRKHRVKTAASDVAISTKAQELANFFKENLPQHVNVTNTATLAHWLKAIRESESVQEASKTHGIPEGSVFDKCSTAAEMLARATRKTEQSVVPSETASTQAVPPTSPQSNTRDAVVFSQNYDDGVSLFDDTGDAGKTDVTTDSTDADLMLSLNSSPAKNNWLPDLLLLIAQLGYDKCFRDVSQCVAMLLIDINAPAPVPMKDKDGDKVNGSNASGGSYAKSMVSVPVSSLSDEIAGFLTHASTLMKRNILLAMISSNESISSSKSSGKGMRTMTSNEMTSLMSFEMMRGDDSILYGAWNAVLADKDFKMGVKKMKQLEASLNCEPNMLLTNPFGAHGFDADTCDRWTFPSSPAQVGTMVVPLKPAMKPIEPPTLNDSLIESEAYKQLCSNYDSNLSSLVLSFPSKPLHGMNGSINNNATRDNESDAAMKQVAVLLGEHASKKSGEYGPCLIAATYDKLNKWLSILEKHAPHLNVLPYWGGSKDRVSMHGFIDDYETGSASSSWHVLLAPVDAVLAEVLPDCNITCWQLIVLDELQPLLMSSNLIQQRASLLRARTCHGRILLQQGLAPNKGKDHDLVAAVTSWSLDTLCGLACGLNPEHHAVIRRVVGRVIADKINCHSLLETQILPLLLSLVQPSVVSLVGKDRDLLNEFALNKVVEWRDIASSATSLAMQAIIKSDKDLGTEKGTDTVNPATMKEKLIKQNIKSICLSFEEFGDYSLNLSSNFHRNQAMWFDSLSKIVPHGNKSTSAVKTLSKTSAPSSNPVNAPPCYDDDFTHLKSAATNSNMSHVTSMSDTISTSGVGDSLVRNQSANLETSTEFMSAWQAPQELEEDAEDELAGDVYPYGDYLYGTAESSARGIGVGGAGGVVLDLSGVPELIPPMPRQRTSGPATSSRYRGVCRSKRTATDKWQAQISYGGTNYYLGLFDSEAEAGVAYARAHYKFYGAGSVGMSSYAVGSASGSNVAPGSGSTTSGQSTASQEEKGSSDNALADGEGEGSEGIEGGATSEADSTSFRLVCSSKVATAVKQDISALKQVATVDGGVTSLNWNDELDKKYWVASEENEVNGGGVKGNSGRPSTPTKGSHLGDKEKKRKSSKLNQDDSSTEVGLQAMVYINDGSDWPFSGALAPSSSLNSTQARDSLVTHPGMTQETTSSSSQNKTSSENILSLEYKGSWSSPSQTPSSNQSSSSSEVPPIAFAMSMLRPLIQLKKQEETSHQLTPQHILILEGKEALDASLLANSSTMESPDTGYAKLIGFVVSSKSNANLAGFHTTINKCNFSVGNAAHELPLAGRAGISAWSRSMSNICGTSVAASASLLTTGAAIGDMDIHLGDNIGPGINARIFWVEAEKTEVSTVAAAVTDVNDESLMSDDEEVRVDANKVDTNPPSKGCFYIHAYSNGVAVEGKAVLSGTRVALSSGSVISFGSNITSDNISFHQPKIITQFLLPSRSIHSSSSQGVKERAKTYRSSEKLMLAALRLATQDSDLRRIIPSLFSTST